MTRSRSTLLALTALFSATHFASCISLDSFFFSPTPVDHYTFAYRDSWPENRRIPEAQRTQLSLDASWVEVDGTAKSTHVAAVWCTQPGDAAATAPTVIYHHGNAANLDRYWDRVSLIYSLGVNVIVYDYPGYGMTAGTPSEPGVFAAAYSAVGFVRGLGARIDQSRVFNYGWSLGGAPATEVASTGHYRGLVIESTFTSVAAMVADGSLVVPRSFVMSNQFDNLSKIRRAASNTQIGVLLFHGDADDFVQTRYGIELDAAIAQDPPASAHDLEIVPNATHSDVPCIAHDGSDCVPAGDDAQYLSHLRPFLLR